MSKQVSESVTGQDKPKPSKQERDNAFSTGGGRKDVEKDLEKEIGKNKSKDGECLEAPIGLDNETKADCCQP